MQSSDEEFGSSSSSGSDDEAIDDPDMQSLESILDGQEAKDAKAAKSKTKSKASDDADHRSMLTAAVGRDMAKEHGTKAQNSTEIGKESDAHVSSDSTRLTVDALLSSLGPTAGTGKLGKRAAAAREAGGLTAALPETAQRRIDRSVAYGNTTKEVTKWQADVKKNREAEQLQVCGSGALAHSDRSVLALNIAGLERARTLK
jgi:U3 small nucleolar RNA-associated protein 14